MLITHFTHKLEPKLQFRNGSCGSKHSDVKEDQERGVTAVLETQEGAGGAVLC